MRRSDRTSKFSRVCDRALRIVAVVGATAWALMGCSAPVHRSAEPAFFHAGRSCDPRPDATFFPADSRVLAVDDHDIATRNQGRLAYRSEPTLDDIEAWPAAPRPSLSGRRYLYISDRPTTYLYFEQPSRNAVSRGRTLFEPGPVFDPRR